MFLVKTFFKWWRRKLLNISAALWHYKKVSCVTYDVTAWKSIGLSSASIVIPNAPNFGSNICLTVKWYVESKFYLKVTGSCLKQDKATLTSPNKVNLFIVCELGTWSVDSS